ncbi:MAG: class I SAM-dependent methyltransferase [Magnetospiraceae bacterium]
MNMVTPVQETPNYTAIKAKQQATWASGNYAVVGTSIQMAGEELCETIDLKAGSVVLDVAAGNGNATLAAARRFCAVTSTDYVPSLLDQARARAEAEGHAIRFETADVEDLPFDDESFEVVMSSFGAMFAPNQMQTAAEMTRVCKTGGTIAMANWTADGFVGQLFKTIGKHLPPPAGLQSPARWGDRTALQELFGDKVSNIKMTPKVFTFRYTSFDHFLSVFRTYYGPIHKAFLALGDDGAALEADIKALCDSLNRAGNDGFLVPSNYVIVDVTK